MLRKRKSFVEDDTEIFFRRYVDRGIFRPDRRSRPFVYHCPMTCVRSAPDPNDIAKRVRFRRIRRAGNFVKLRSHAARLGGNGVDDTIPTVQCDVRTNTLFIIFGDYPAQWFRDGLQCASSRRKIDRLSRGVHTTISGVQYTLHILFVYIYFCIRIFTMYRYT